VIGQSFDFAQDDISFDFAQDDISFDFAQDDGVRLDRDVGHGGS
jgi:hypothetical protein